MMNLRRLLPLILALLAAVVQYEVLQMFEAGRRQGFPVVVGSFFVAAIAVYGMPRLTASKMRQFSVCVLAPAIVACVVLLIAEKVERPEISIMLRPGGLELAAFTTLVTAGWLVGLAAFCGHLLAQHTQSHGNPPAKP